MRCALANSRAVGSFEGSGFEEKLLIWMYCGQLRRNCREEVGLRHYYGEALAIAAERG